YVNKNVAGTSTQSGTSWGNAYGELRDALTNSAVAQASQGNPVEIWVAKGTYFPAATTSTDRTSAFILKSHLRILGGFQGTEVTDTQRLFFGNATVLSGDIGAVQANAITTDNAESFNPPVNPTDPNLTDNCYNVVRGIGVTDVILDKLVIANGAAISNGFSGIQLDGMSAVNTDTNAELTGTTVNALDPVVAGGGLYFENSHTRSTNVNLVINNCTFLNNAAMGYGGGVAAKEAHVEIVYTTFQGNSAGEEGGAFFGQNNNYDFGFCNFINNYADGSGGALGLETISSDATMPPFNDPKAFEQSLGVSPKDFRTYVGYGIAAASGIPNMYRTFSTAYNTSKGFWKVLGRGFRASLPQNPASSTEAVGNGLKAEAGVGSRVAGAYAYLTLAISVTDFAVDIADHYGAVDENNPDYKRWKIFSEGFNQYATPQGWATMLVGVILKAAVNDEAEKLRDSTEALKRFQLYAYNQASYSTVAFCTFQNNYAAAQGGAVELAHDNVQFEGCKFTGNIGNDDGGAMALTAWTTPKVFNCTFYQNISTNGNSGIVNFEHARSQIINCTFYDNYSTATTNGYAVSCLHGSEVTLFNSILWGNTNSTTTNALGGADVYAEKQADLMGDTNLVKSLQDAGAAIGDWVGICDVANCDVQSLNRIPTGRDDIPLFGHRSYTDDEANAVLKARQDGEDSGTLVSYGFINMGEGVRPTLLDSAHGNISVNPQLNSSLLPAIGNAVIDGGSKKRFNNSINRTTTGTDVLQNDRLVGASYDMGAVERTEGFAEGDIVYVRSVATGNGSGSSWANATANLQGAINGAASHQVWVAAGTYYPTSGSDRSVSFALVTGVSVYGGFNGTEASLSQRNWTANPTILSGDIGTHGNHSDNSYHVINNLNVNGRALLDGFTITKGRSTTMGGGMYNTNSYPTIRNCKFIDNQATGSGGAVASQGTEGSEFYNCQFISNSAVGGGALYFASRLRTEGCLFLNNSGAAGGALQLDTSDYAYLFNTLFVSNSISGSSAYGGAIFNYETDLRLYNCTFYKNSAILNNGTLRGGGAIEQSARHTSFSAQNCIFWNNTATNIGGPTASVEHQQIIASSAVQNTIQNCIVEGLNDFAGAIYDGNMDTDPSFASAASGNLQLTASSAAVDAGRDFIG
ncbi:MAG: C-terminal target protein, partial [Verrucomicrobiales bacterium]|nr:C-terminal target protein [Verrucomicrobiales bacterium]